MDPAALQPGEPEDTFTVWRRRIDLDEAPPAQWSVYVIRVDLAGYEEPPALKVGAVGTGTIRQRLATHSRDFGAVQLVDCWTVAHAASRLDELARWRLVEQLEARLQFAAEFVDPAARLRRLNPKSGTYSFEWFEDDDRVLEAVATYAPRPVTLPHGWTMAADPVPVLAVGAVEESEAGLRPSPDPMVESEDVLTLPEFAGLDPDEQLLARVCVAWAKRPGTMFQGRLLEAHVAGLLDAEWPTSAISSWDLKSEGIRLQVRSAAPTGSFVLTGLDGVDVFVLVVKPDPSGAPGPTEHWDHGQLDYYVLSVSEVREIARRTVRVQRLRDWATPYEAQSLKPAVRAGYQREQAART